MKKTFLALLLAGSSCALFAQTDSLKTDMTDPTTNETLSTTFSYDAYSTYNAALPTYMQTYVVRDYPMATDVRWQQNGDWWHGYYLNNGAPSHVFYNERGQTFMAALPVRQTFVPDEIVSKAVSIWGPVMYDIHAIKGSEGQDVYHVRIIENGTLASQYMGADGSKVIDVYRMEIADAELESLNANPETQNITTDPAMNKDEGIKEMKIKTKTTDGKKTKTKIEGDKVKVKED
jgi:hypothetical protein